VLRLQADIGAIVVSGQRAPRQAFHSGTSRRTRRPWRVRTPSSRRRSSIVFDRARGSRDARHSCSSPFWSALRAAILDAAGRAMCEPTGHLHRSAFLAVFRSTIWRRTSSAKYSEANRYARRGGAASRRAAGFSLPHRQRLGDVAVLDHAVDDPVAALDEPASVAAERMIVGRTLRQRGEIGGLGDCQFGHRLVEIGERRAGNAIGIQAEEDLVEIEFENACPSNRPARCGRRGSLP
jgi:hypothetical protein